MLTVEQVEQLPPDNRVIIAYDGLNLAEATELHATFNEAGFNPIAKANSLVMRPGLDAVMEAFVDLDSEVMFDPKHHDTPATMRNYIEADAQAEPRPPLFVTLHASNGQAALEQAVEGRKALTAEHENAVNLLGITVLTSLDDDDVVSIFGEGATAEGKFIDFAHRAANAELQGLVSSGEELLRGYEFRELDGLIRVIPGIKLPDGNSPSGQKRVITPDRAIADGAHFVVIGRAITNAEEPVAALEQAVELVVKEV